MRSAGRGYGRLALDAFAKNQVAQRIDAEAANHPPSRRDAGQQGLRRLIGGFDKFAFLQSAFEFGMILAHYLRCHQILCQIAPPRHRRLADFRVGRAFT